MLNKKIVVRHYLLNEINRQLWEIVSIRSAFNRYCFVLQMAKHVTNIFTHLLPIHPKFLVSQTTIRFFFL